MKQDHQVILSTCATWTKGSITNKSIVWQMCFHPSDRPNLRGHRIPSARLEMCFTVAAVMTKTSQSALHGGRPQSAAHTHTPRRLPHALHSAIMLLFHDLILRSYCRLIMRLFSSTGHFELSSCEKPGFSFFYPKDIIKLYWYNIDIDVQQVYWPCSLV